MAEPTDDVRRGRLRLVLDDGEVLELATEAESGASIVILRLPAARAYDLSRVLDSYTAMVELAGQASEVSGTEATLARALRDSAAAAGQRHGSTNSAGTVGEPARLQAMAELQAARPDLNHGSLIAVVDAAAAWVAQREDYHAAALLDAVAGDDGAGSQAYLTLIGYDRLPSRGETR